MTAVAVAVAEDVVNDDCVNDHVNAPITGLRGSRSVIHAPGSTG